ncbi:Pr6Pr family membrane protein [Devosia lucknowensis]|nr:Pr6Pr family membrane protein [Devosia lucknowensis]
MLNRALTWAGLVIGIAGLVLQFSISMPDLIANGRDVPGALGHFFSYYTVLNNIALVLVYLSAVTHAGWLELFRSPLVRGIMAANIALVGLYVFFVLRFLQTLEGAFFVADAMLHYVAPVLYVVWWTVTQRHGALRWTHLPLMLLPTLIYFVYAMARGAWVQEYPYPILNAVELGYRQVGINALYMTVFLAVLALVAIAADRFLARTSRTVPQ